MKKVTFFLALTAFTCTTVFSQGNVAINNDGSLPASSAMLDIKSSTKGVLVPRMTTAQRIAIASPVTGLLVFDSNAGSFWYYNGTGWSNLAAAKLLSDADGSTKVQVEKNPGEDIIRFDVGGSENMVLQKNASGILRLELKDVNQNTYLGEGTGSSTTNIGGGNVATGNLAFHVNTSGSINTATGAASLYSNTIGQRNVATGYQALYSNTSGYANTAHGTAALYANSTGYSNVGMGVNALYQNTTIPNLVAVGDSALYNNGLGASQPADGTGNTALGSKALYANSTGYYNTAQGYQALYANTSGTQNTANGMQALYSNTTGFNNAVNGFQALYSNTTGFSNVGIGIQALFLNTSKSNLVAIGDSALYNNGVGAFANVQGAQNVAVGSKTLYANNIGSYNTAVGSQSLKANVDGNFNSAFGLKSLTNNVNGMENTAIGYATLLPNISGGSNTAIGARALFFSNGGSWNTAVGAAALYSNVSGSSNTAIGYLADVTSGNLTGAVAIGTNSKVGCSNCLVLGGTGANAVKVGIGTSTPTTAQLVINTAAASTGIDLSSADAYAEMRVIRNTLGSSDKDLYLGFGSPAGSNLHLYSDGIETMTVKGQKIGIGTSAPSQALHVIGNICATGTIGTCSDIRYKMNLLPVSNAITALLNIHPIYYNWNQAFKDKGFATQRQIGFSAQEVEKYFPEMVQTDGNGYKAVDYSRMTAVLVAAVTEQQKEIEALKASTRNTAAQQKDIDALKQQVAELLQLVKKQQQ